MIGTFTSRVNVMNQNTLLAHSWFNWHMHPKLVPIFYSAIKHGYRCCISLLRKDGDVSYVATLNNLIYGPNL